MTARDRSFAADTRPARPSNPPGRTEIAFRLADQNGFLDWLRQMLRHSGPVAVAPGDDADADPAHRRLAVQNALNRLNRDDPRGFVTALLKGWAAVGDVLTFYQERIANEGYLRTAIEPLSVGELTRAIGYRPRPALSATTDLAFSLLDARPRHEKLILPAGTAVQSVPLPGQTPVVFETDEEIEARPVWNAMVPAIPKAPHRQQLVEGATHVRVRGAAPGVRPGASLLLCGTPAEDGGAASHLRRLIAVEREADKASTLLRWQEPLPGLTGRPLIDAAKVFVFRQTARLFAATIPAWEKQPDSVKAKFGLRRGDIAFAPFARPANAGLPAGNVTTMVIGPDGAVYAAIAATLLCHDGDVAWRTMGTTPNRTAVSALVAAGDGRLYAGTQRGEALASSDRGANWFAVQGPFGIKPEKHEMARLPAVVINTLAAIPSAHGITTLLAGTPVGLWRTEVNGGNWRGWNEGLPGYDAAPGSAGVAVTGILEDPTERKRFILATDKGLFHAGEPGSHWHPAAIDPGWAAELRSVIEGAQKGGRAALTAIGELIRKEGRQTPAIHAIAALSSDRRSAIFAGHDHGVLRSTDGGKLWRPTGSIPGPGPAPLPVTRLAADGERILAGTAAGLFVSTDDGEHWEALSGLFSEQAVVALAAGDGQAVAAAPFAGFAEPDRTELSLATAGPDVGIHLDRVYSTAVPGSWLVFAPEGAPATAHQVLSVAAVSQVADQTRRRVSKLAVASPGPAAALGTGTVHLCSAALDLVDNTVPPPAVLSGDAPIKLAGAVEGLAGRRVAVTGRRACVCIPGPAGGVRQWGPDRQGWSLIGDGDQDGRILLATRPGSAGEPATLLLGGETEVHRLHNGEWVQCGHLRQSTNALTQAPDGSIVAATDGGVWHHSDEGPANKQDWLCAGLVERKVSAVAFSGDGTRLWAGTDAGLFHRQAAALADTVAWSAERSSGGARITALILTRQGLAAATADGRILLEAENDWRIAAGPPASQLNALAVDAEGGLVAATNGGLFRSLDGAASWTRHPAAGAGDDVRALAIDPAGAVWTAVHGRGVAKDGRPLRTGVANEFRSFAFLDGAVFASSLSSATLLPDDPAEARHFAEPALLTQFQDAAIAAELADGPASAALHRLLAGHHVDLPKSPLVQRRPGTQSWSIGEPGSAVSLLLRASPLSGSDDDERPTWRVFHTTDFEVMGRAEPLDGDEAFALWRLRTAGGATVTLVAGKDELVYRPSHAGCQTAAEVCRVAGAEISADRRTTTLLLSPSLANVYDAATTTFNANVAAASHGQSPPLYEAVGSGDASRGNQTFLLRRSPLSALATDTEPFHQFAISLRVRPSRSNEPLAVNGQLRPRDLESEAVAWRQVPTLSESGPEDQHFTVDLGDDGRATVSFGDGRRGKRLPTGMENVTALYRVGGGPDGNVGTNRLTLLTKRPAGVRRVTNPLPASGGTAADGPDEIRENAPLAIRSSGRLVAQRDYEDFVRAWPGIAKVAVRRLPAPHALLHVTIADDVTAAATPQSPPVPIPDRSELSQAILANSAMRHRLRIERCKIDWFNLAAEIAVIGGHDPVAVLADLRAMLSDGYGFGRQDLIQPVRAAVLTARMQASPGVRAVYLRELYLLGHKPDLARELSALPARPLPNGDIAPAELLLINPRKTDAKGHGGGIVLTLVTT